MSCKSVARKLHTKIEKRSLRQPSEVRTRHPFVQGIHPSHRQELSLARMNMFVREYFSQWK